MPEELKRDLDLLLLTAIGVGAMVGSGVYTLPGLVASVSGPLSVLAVLLMSAITGLFVYILAELGKELPTSGALYYFARGTFGDLAGFITGFSFYVSCFVGTAAIIYAFVLYASYFLKDLASGLTLTPLGTALALVLLAAVTAVNVVGVKHGALLNLALTVLRVVPLLLFVAVGLLSFKPANLEQPAPYGYGGLALAVAFGFWMFVGFESLVLVGDEVRRPSETIVKSALVTVLTVSALYTLLIASFTGSISWAGLGLREGDWQALSSLSSPLADAARALGHEWLAWVMVLGAAISSAGCFSDWVLLQARVAYALAREGHLWGKLSYVHPRFRTPAAALLFSSLLTGVVIALVPSFPSVILIAMIAEFVPYGVSALSLAASRAGLAPKVLGLAGLTLASLYVYWACWPWTLTGAAVALAGLGVYLAVRGGGAAGELGRSSWYIAYLLGLAALSLLGDQTFTYNNFLPVSPLDILRTPLDIAAVAAFSAVIFAWAMLAGRPKTTPTGAVRG